MPAAAPDHAGPTDGGAASVGDASVDLGITFDPRVTGSLGWARLPKPVTLDMLGNPGAAILDGTARYALGKEGEPLRAAWLEAMLRKAPLEDTSILADDAFLCSRELRSAVERLRPARLLVSIESGIGQRTVDCLGALSVRRLYLAGCLYRSHQNDPCDGDGELAALGADPAMQVRVRGLALSIGKLESLATLAAFPTLEYLALSPGAGAPERALVDELPFDALPGLRYLEASGENEHASALGGDALRFIARLHTLRWNGELAGLLSSPCRLERASFDMIHERDVEALAVCTGLRELSTDGTRFDSAKPVARLESLERLHLRHWKGDDAALLAKLRRLTSLSIPASHAADFGFVGTMTGLRSVDLSQTSLATLGPFATLANLESLDVDFTAVSDLAPLAGLKRLAELHLHETKVADVAVVARLGALRELSISKTNVTSVAPLARHPSLERVTLYESRVTDAAPLLAIPSLKRAHVARLSLPKDQLDQLRARLGRELIE